MKRDHTRFKFVNKATIFDGRNEFECSTVNGSMSGLLIKIDGDSNINLKSKEYILMITDKKIKLKTKLVRVEFKDGLTIGIKINASCEPYNSIMLARGLEGKAGEKIDQR